MADLLGFATISIASLITLLVALRWPRISNILFVALIVRVLLLLIGHYVITLPGGTADAIGFEEKAWDLAQGGFFYALSHFDFNPFVFFSWLHAIPYSLFGRSILMAQSIGLIFGIGTVFFAWKLATVLWDNRSAKKVGWVMALFPSLVLYSVLFLREVYISFFLLLAVYGMVNWIKTDSFKSIFLSLAGFIGATLFHGASFAGAIIFIIIVLITYLKRLFKSLINLRINFKILIVFLLFLIIFGFYLSNKISIYYLGSFEKSTNIKVLLEKIYYSTQGEASWPHWTIATSGIELLYKAPIRSLYFLFSPFPWDIKTPKHLIGLLDGFLYMYLVFLILRNRKVIWKDPALRTVLIILLFYIIVFGIGIGNFGTSLRHKSKFTFMFILLAAPLIKSLVFFKKNKS